jgi:hypothetical protein
MTEEDVSRFWSHVRSGPPDECWHWVGAMNAGYGAFKVSKGGKLSRIAAHRVMYELEIGGQEFADNYSDLVVRHQCDNPCCVNPMHLTAGTHRDNVQDRVDRDRSARGERNGRSKFTEEAIRLIRHCHEDLGLSPNYIARICQVDAAAVRRILNRESWRHVA